MRNLSLDILKIIMAFFVVFLHMHLFKEVYPSLSYVLVNGLFRLGVPTFLIISGYYFFFIDEQKKLKKWLVRLFVLYAIWSIVYIPFWKEKEDILMNIVFGFHHLWYLIGTFLGGILLYLLRNKSATFLGTLSIVLFLTGYTIQYFANSHYFSGEVDLILNRFSTYRNFLFVCFPFLTIGFLIKRHQIEKKFKPNFFMIIGLCILVMLEAYFNMEILKLKKQESIDLLISLLFVCPILFVYSKNKVINSSSKWLANISTAIYCIHPILMEWLLEKQDVKSFSFFILCLLGASIGLVLINKKIKYIL